MRESLIARSGGGDEERDISNGTENEIKSLLCLYLDSYGTADKSRVKSTSEETYWYCTINTTFVSGLCQYSWVESKVSHTQSRPNG